MKYLLLFIFFVASLSAYSQDYNNMLGMSIGTSIPINSFAKANNAYYNSTCVKSGIMLGFDDVYFITNHIGVTAVASFTQNGVNTDSIEYNVTHRVSDLLSNLDNSFIFPDKNNYALTIGTWTQANLMAGAVFSLPVKFIFFDFRALAGLSVISSPAKELKFGFLDGDFNSFEKIQTTPSIIYLLGTSLRYQLPSGYIVRFMLDWTYSKATIEINDQIISTTQVPEMNIKNNYDFTSNLLYAGLSFAYDF